MLIISFVSLVITVTLGTRITRWFTPLVSAEIAGLLLKEVNFFLILGLCLLGAAIGDTGLWFFDQQIHKFISKKLKHKKHKHMHKNTHLGMLSHHIREKVKLIENKWTLFFGIMCASFSIVPDFLIVEFARTRMKFIFFITAITIGKIFIYGPIIWGGIELIKLFS